MKRYILIIDEYNHIELSKASLERLWRGSYGYLNGVTFEDYLNDLINNDTIRVIDNEDLSPKRFLVQKMIDDEVFSRIMTANELIKYIDMNDCYDEKFEIFDCDTVFGSVRKLYYKGWQPGCLIEIVDDQNNVVLKGYGTDH